MNNPLTRRALLQAGSLAAGSLLLSRFAAAAEASPVKLGIASYTFREFKQPQQLIGFMKQLNLRAINLKDFHLPMTPLDQVAAEADVYRKAGLIITGGGTIYFPKDEDEDIKAKFDYAKAAGFPMIIGSPTHASIGRVESFVKKYDIKLAIHNHGTEDKEWPSPHDILKVIGNMDKRVGCCVDLGHAMRAGDDLPTTLREVGPRLYDIHIKDLADKNSKESQVAVGEGVMPVKAIFQTLAEMKYPGYVDLEYEINGKDPMPGVEKSIAFERKVLADLGYSA
ncbi:MAG: sugar phosphate isomerase/epimerase family protein [Janthinobacterium lividum]